MFEKVYGIVLFVAACVALNVGAPLLVPTLFYYGTSQYGCEACEECEDEAIVAESIDDENKPEKRVKDAD